MKLSVVVCTQDVIHGPLALLSGPFDDKVKKAREIGYEGIELMVRDPSQLDLTFIRTELMLNELKPVQVVTGELFGADKLCLVTPKVQILRKAQERIKSVIAMASELGAYVNIGRFRGRFDWMDSNTVGYKVAQERIGEIAGWAAEKKVMLTIEPINRYEVDFILNTQEGIRFITDLGCKNVGLVLDLFHMNIEDASIERSLEEAMSAGLLWHIHVADSDRWYPGHGHLDFDTIINTLHRVGYGGYLSAELLPLPDPDTAARETARFLLNII